MNKLFSIVWILILIMISFLVADSLAHMFFYNVYPAPEIAPTLNKKIKKTSNYQRKQKLIYKASNLIRSIQSTLNSENSNTSKVNEKFIKADKLTKKLTKKYPKDIYTIQWRSYYYLLQSKFYVIKNNNKKAQTFYEKGRNLLDKHAFKNEGSKKIIKEMKSIFNSHKELRLKE